MKNSVGSNLLNIRILIITTFILSISGYSFAGVNTRQLEKDVEKKVSAYYTELFRYSADAEGNITVEGETSSLYDKLNVEDLIAQVENVHGIINKISVKTEQTADGIIKANIENELQENNVILEPEKIIVNVKNGVVNISGTVNYFREKLMAQSIVSWQDGVTDMVSNLTVLSPAAARSDDNLNEIITNILKNHFPAELNVRYELKDGYVRLYGSANSMYAIKHIQQEIQHILGVKDVVNNITLADKFSI